MVMEPEGHERVVVPFQAGTTSCAGPTRDLTIMAKTTKAAPRSLARSSKTKRAPLKLVAKTRVPARATANISARRPASRRSGLSASGFLPSDMFNPSAWFGTLVNSPTGRKAMADALVAAAGAAAAVLIAQRQGSRGVAAAEPAKRNSGDVMKQAAKSAAVAATGVLGAMATDMIGHAAKSLLAPSKRSDGAAAVSERDPRDAA